jgi:hypothetical protein
MPIPRFDHVDKKPRLRSHYGLMAYRRTCSTPAIVCTARSAGGACLRA